MSLTQQQEVARFLREHPSIEYLLRPEIAITVSQALAHTYKNNPNDPVDFFARQLLHQIDIKSRVQAVIF